MFSVKLFKITDIYCHNMNKINFYLFNQIVNSFILVFFIFVSVAWLLQLSRLFNVMNNLQIKAIDIVQLSFLIIPNLINVLDTNLKKEKEKEEEKIKKNQEVNLNDVLDVNIVNVKNQEIKKVEEKVENVIKIKIKNVENPKDVDKEVVLPLDIPLHII